LTNISLRYNTSIVCVVYTAMRTIKRGTNLLKNDDLSPINVLFFNFLKMTKELSCAGAILGHIPLAFTIGRALLQL